jgi:hypothetical protein
MIHAEPSDSYPYVTFGAELREAEGGGAEKEKQGGAGVEI